MCLLIVTPTHLLDLRGKICGHVMCPVVCQIVAVVWWMRCCDLQRCLPPSPDLPKTYQNLEGRVGDVCEHTGCKRELWDMVFTLKWYHTFTGYTLCDWRFLFLHVQMDHRTLNYMQCSFYFKRRMTVCKERYFFLPCHKITICLYRSAESFLLLASGKKIMKRKKMNHGIFGDSCTVGTT